MRRILWLLLAVPLLSACRWAPALGPVPQATTPAEAVEVAQRWAQSLPAA